MIPNKTYSEELHRGFGTTFEADEIYFDSETDHQRIVVFKNSIFGRMMMLDGVTQTTEADEFIYHEMLSHTPILAHGNALKVLIIGGGDGGMLREVLRHPGVEKCTMVEIDNSVVELSKQYLPNHSQGAFDDPRANLVFGDGAAFVLDPDDRYDVMIVDSTDPIGPGEVLFQDNFYANTRNCLNPDGILVAQNGVPFLQADELRNSMTHLKQFYSDVSCYLATIPTYVGGPMAFGWASNTEAHRKIDIGILEQRFSELGIQTRYYTPTVHMGAFALPPYISDLIE